MSGRDLRTVAGVGCAGRAEVGSGNIPPGADIPVDLYHRADQECGQDEGDHPFFVLGENEPLHNLFTSG